MNRCQVLIVGAAVAAAAARPAAGAVFFHDDFDSHTPGPLAGQSADVGGTWSGFDPSFFAIP